MTMNSKSVLLATLCVAAVVAAGCGSAASTTPGTEASNALIQWTSMTHFDQVVGDLQNDTAKINESIVRSRSKLTLQTLCGILLIDVQTANNNLPTPDRTATKLAALAYGDLGAGANQCFSAATVHSPEMVRSTASRTKGLIELAQTVSRIEAVTGQPVSTTTTTTLAP